jgi:hypothetical protein
MRCANVSVFLIVAPDRQAYGLAAEVVAATQTSVIAAGTNQ